MAPQKIPSPVIVPGDNPPPAFIESMLTRPSTPPALPASFAPPAQLPPGAMPPQPTPTVLPIADDAGTPVRVPAFFTAPPAPIAPVVEADVEHKVGVLRFVEFDAPGINVPSRCGFKQAQTYERAATFVGPRHAFVATRIESLANDSGYRIFDETGAYFEVSRSRVVFAAG